MDSVAALRPCCVFLKSTPTVCFVHKSEKRHGGVWGMDMEALWSALPPPDTQKAIWSKERLPGCQDAVLKSHHFTATAPPSVWDPAVVWPPFLDPQVLCQASAQTKVSPPASPLRVLLDSAKWPVSICHPSRLHRQMEGLMVEQAMGLALSQLDNSGW